MGTGEGCLARGLVRTLSPGLTLAQPGFVLGWLPLVTSLVSGRVAILAWAVHLVTVDLPKLAGLCWGLKSSVQVQQLQGGVNIKCIVN